MAAIPLKDGEFLKEYFVYVQAHVLYSIYRKVSNIRRTKSQNLNASRLIW